MLLLYNSDTYARLQDAESGLYYQSLGYVLDCLDNELTTGKCFRNNASPEAKSTYRSLTGNSGHSTSPFV